MSAPIAERLARVRDRIAAAARRADREPDAVALVGVTKTVEPERIEQAAAAGLTLFGENRVQEALPKVDQLPRLRWHFIGSLQRNKAKQVVGTFEMIHSLDSIRLARAIDRAAADRGLVADVLVQVNVGGEETKSGIEPGEALAELVREAAHLEHLRIRGLMTIPPFCDDPEAARPFFRRLRAEAEALGRLDLPGLSLGELSMGMSGDFEVAIEEGATMVRVGSAIFGERPRP